MSLHMLVFEPKEPSRLLNIKLEECLFWESVGRKLHFQHRNGKRYVGVQNLADFEGSEELADIGIMLTDRTNYVNVREVRTINKELGLLFFEGHPTSKSIKASVARINIRAIQRMNDNVAILKKF